MENLKTIKYNIWLLWSFHRIKLYRNRTLNFESYVIPHLPKSFSKHLISERESLRNRSTVSSSSQNIFFSTCIACINLEYNKLKYLHDTIFIAYTKVFLCYNLVSCPGPHVLKFIKDMVFWRMILYLFENHIRKHLSLITLIL